MFSLGLRPRRGSARRRAKYRKTPEKGLKLCYKMRRNTVSERGMDDPNRIRFGGFVLDRARGRLEDEAGSERFLRPKAYRVFEFLCERRGELVSKDELVREAWPDVFVSDVSLAHCISDIRRALGPEGAELLRTIPRRGYMLVASEPRVVEAAGRPIARPWMILAGGLAGGLYRLVDSAAQRDRGSAGDRGVSHAAGRGAARGARLAAARGQRAARRV